ncbi:family 39 glycosyltransferase [Cokeromyces recurvatus]|uniref:family 39 glycosyltransferase n=1 Tax=Cokeromyces recurvatus TaxID=90255 RepID=UPI00221F52E4|nr:family 39 glycosyltransferase [Cokeromyces recurvatus]KAI7897594.1 family 39 glycosyltransferase [Cokeromyces recurvatus]
MDTLKRRHLYHSEDHKQYHDSFETIHLEDDKKTSKTSKAQKRAHFGKFGSFYLRHEFYFDVHPPLGKMLVGASGWLANYNGSFSFESGKAYPDDLDIATMRRLNAFWGVFLVPLAFGTAHQLQLSFSSCLLASTMVLLDNALLTISRFVLLDSMLLFFTSMTFFCLAGFRAHRNASFSRQWWTWLLGLGISLGCVLSVKWVGLFAVALAGTYTIEDLWDMLGDLKMPKKTYLNHWLSRILCLILIPLLIYVASFAVHFYILSNSGPGDAVMSSLFQANLNGSTIKDNPFEIAFGSNVTLKNYGYGGGLLHSHPHFYPEGSRQQQITAYSFKDLNNLWQLRYPHNDATNNNNDTATVQFIKDGDIVRLFHLNTGHNLHSHPIPAPISIKHWEVSAYGNESSGDFQDHWQLEVVQNVQQDKQVGSLMTRFRLRHVYLHCYLATHTSHLPSWGFKQQEVYCDRRGSRQDHRTWWNVEEHRHEQLSPAPKYTFKSNYLEDIWRLNVAMWNANNALIPDPDKNDMLTSSPLEWPTVLTGLRMCNWDKNTVKYYLIGNPTVWWISSMAIIGFVASLAIYKVRKQRHIILNVTPGRLLKFWSVGKLFFLGWFFHYVPFFMMGRVTYLHHYFPALYFSIFMVPFLIEHFCGKSRFIVFTVVMLMVVMNFIYFAPLSFGMEGDIQQYTGRWWIKRWNLIENLN